MKVCFLIIVIVSGLSLLISPARALDVTAKNGSAVAIQEAVDQVAAAGGGNVYIPAGTFNFVEVGEPWMTVVVPAGVNISGAPTERTSGLPVPDRGMNPNDQVVEWKTKIIMPYDVPGGWLSGTPYWFRVVGSGNPGESTRISDIKLIGYRTIDPTSVTLHRGFSIDNVRDFRIDHCSFEHISGGPIEIWGLHARGVIDHCKIFNMYGFDDLADGYRSTIGYGTQINREWTGITFDPTMSVLGQYTDYTVFIEDCNYTKWRHCVASGDGAHYVFRHNNIDGDMGHFSLDAHGLRQAEPHGGTRCAEYYENKIINCVPDPENPPSGLVLQNGGGCGVWFNNFVDSSYQVGSITLYPEDYVASETWHLKDFYLWSNLGDWTPTPDGIPSGFTADRNVLADWGRPAYNMDNPNYPNVDPSWSIAGYQPYTYPHPLTLGETTTTTTTIGTTTTTFTTTTIHAGQVTISGQLMNATGPIQADVIVYNQGTSQVNTSDTTDPGGNYDLSIWPDTYDLQYNILEFFIQNFFIKLVSLDVFSDLQNVVNYVTGYPSENITFTVNVTTDQEIRVHSEDEPKTVKANGVVMTEGALPLSPNEWYYDSSNKELYMKVSLPTTTTTTIPSTTTTTSVPATTTTTIVTTTTVPGTTTTTIPGTTTTSTTTTTIPGAEKTFGNTNVGSTFTGAGNSIFGSKYKLTETAQVSKISAYLHTATGSDASAAIYSDYSGSPDVLQASSNSITLSSWDWYDFTLNANLLPDDYWLVIRCGSCYFRNSTGENQQYARRWDSGNFPTQFGSVVEWNDWNISIYATYTT